MKNYDEVVGFDYTDPEEWKNFVKNEILPIYKSILKIERVRDNTAEKLSKNKLSELLGKDKSIQQILLGGVDKNGNYKSNSLAKIYKEFLGISIDTERWAKLSKQHENPEDYIDEYIEVNFADNTPFLEFIDNVKSIVEAILFLLKIPEEEPTKKEINEIVENPVKIANELKELYKRLFKITANYDYHTFFAINTRSVPRYYIEEAYPKLKDKFDEVAEFLGIKKKFTPDVKDKKKKRDYTVWGHKQGGLADLLYELNKTVWDHTMNLIIEYPYSKGLELIVGQIKNLRGDYATKCINILKRMKWKIPNYIDVYAVYEISGIFLKDHSEIPILKFLTDMAPTLFLGLIELNIRKNEVRLNLHTYEVEDLYEEEY